MRVGIVVREPRQDEQTGGRNAGGTEAAGHLRREEPIGVAVKDEDGTRAPAKGGFGIPDRWCEASGKAHVADGLAKRREAAQRTR